MGRQSARDAGVDTRRPAAGIGGRARPRRVRGHRHFTDEVLGHRVLLNYDGLADNVKVLDLVKELVAAVPEES